VAEFLNDRRCGQETSASYTWWNNPRSVPQCAYALQLACAPSSLCVQVNNPLVHEMSTGPEIIEAVVSTPSTPARPSSGKVDVVICGAGTGGTISGVSRAITKAHNKDCIIVGVDPVSQVP
jgi:cystathionine beta-synthase